MRKWSHHSKPRDTNNSYMWPVVMFPKACFFLPLHNFWPFNPWDLSVWVRDREPSSDKAVNISRPEPVSPGYTGIMFMFKIGAAGLGMSGGSNNLLWHSHPPFALWFWFSDRKSQRWASRKIRAQANATKSWGFSRLSEVMKSSLIYISEFIPFTV